jgi:hypothetical protein
MMTLKLTTITLGAQRVLYITTTSKTLWLKWTTKYYSALVATVELRTVQILSKREAI